MPSFNKVFLMGHMTRDPQLRYLPSQKPVSDFGIACNRKYKTQSGEEKEEVLFVDCSVFGRTAEVINQHFTKGKPIFIEGRLKYETWEDKNGGGKRNKITVTVDNFQFIGGRDDEEKPRGGQMQSPRERSIANGPRKPTYSEVPRFTDDGSIPF